MHGTVVGVLRGGPSSEHEVSLRTGHAIVANLPRDRYTVRDIYIDKQGAWHERGKPALPAEILRSIDVAVIALHGAYGEDGEVQRLLEQFGIPYTGSDSLSSRIAMHKALSKERAAQIGLKTPKHFVITTEDNAEFATYKVIRTFHQPVVVKPVQAGSSVGVHIVGGYAEVLRAINTLLAEAQHVMVEEYIRGVEATVGVVENLRNERLYALPPIEIVPPANDFFSYEAKYSSKSQEICPGRFSKQEMEQLMSAAQAIHDALGLRHYSRSDFMVTPKGVYYLETNTLPGLTRESLFPKSLGAVGMPFPEFLTHIVELARA